MSRLLAVLTLVSSWSCAALALAQEAADERATSFEAVQGAVKEDVPGGPLLLAAYAVIWIFVLLFVMRLVRQQGQCERDLARLEKQLAKAPGHASG